MAVVATRRRDNDGRFVPTTNCHPNPPWFAGRRERLRCGPERAFDEVAASELLPKRSITRFARGIVKAKLKIVVAEARSSALRGLNHGPATHRRRIGTSSCRSPEPARNGNLGHRMASRRCRRRIGRGHLVARRHDDVVQDDGDGTPPLAAGTVDNTCLIKNLVRRMIVT
jgi:hypothetical protein